MEREFGISRGDVEAAEAETARKLAADRAVELESPALKTYVSQYGASKWTKHINSEFRLAWAIRCV